MVKAPLAASTVLVASLLWAIALTVDPAQLGSAPASLLSFGLVVDSTVALVGMIVVGGRWAHRLGVGVMAITVIVAVIRPVDPLWVLGVAATAISVVALSAPRLTRVMRKLPSASGPPPRVVAVPLLLLAAPCLLGLTGADATVWALLTVGLSGPVAAFLYSRVLPGGLLAVRLLWPALTLALAPTLGLACGSTSGALAIVVVTLSWHPLVKTSFHPPLERGSSFPVPPELVPDDVLDAADIDERGRPR
jgi:hypothetical protein